MNEGTFEDPQQELILTFNIPMWYLWILRE